jgi:biotin-dependent carboxylase-like uncharacterized protein
MMLEVVDGGLLTTVQDAGRPDWTHIGVPTSGAADAWSLAVANLLVGNDRGEAALEMTIVGPRLRARHGGVIALAGADLGARIAGGPRLAVGRTHAVAATDVIEFDRDERSRGCGDGGARCYLAIPGGVDVPVVLGSRSTCLPGGFGGVEGRVLRAGDVIAARGGAGVPRPAADLVWPRAAEDLAGLEGTEPVTLRIVPGTGPGIEELLDIVWRVSAAADRVGIRLDGGVLPERARGEVLTHGIPPGAIQVPPDGRPIILAADHQTTGGYRAPAVVIGADLRHVGQLVPGVDVRFERTDLAAADAALRAQRDELAAGAAAMREAAGWHRLATMAGG